MKKEEPFMHLKHRHVLILAALAVLLMLASLLAGCGSSSQTTTSAPAQTTTTTQTTAPAVNEFDTVRAAMEAYLTSGPQWNISASDLYMLLNDGDDSNDPFIVSVRAAAQYAKGHIPGAINIPLSGLADPANLAKLPKDKQIVVYCYTGHTGSQGTALLNLMGYNATNLKFGMTAWTHDVEVAPGRYDPAKDRMDYAFETTPNTVAADNAPPVLDVTTSSDPTEIVRAAVEAYVTSSPKWNISASDLYMLLNDGDDSNDPLILSVRAADQYAKGHIPGAINIGLADLADPNSLAMLPTDRQIVVYCYTGMTGSQATALLNTLGYNATNLKFGMTSWTMDTTVAPGAFDNATSSFDYPFVTGTSPE
jgi:rhodanese-related sulfurtransferase